MLSGRAGIISLSGEPEADQVVYHLVSQFASFCAIWYFALYTLFVSYFLYFLNFIIFILVYCCISVDWCIIRVLYYFIYFSVLRHHLIPRISRSRIWWCIIFPALGLRPTAETFIHLPIIIIIIVSKLSPIKSNINQRHHMLWNSQSTKRLTLAATQSVFTILITGRGLHQWSPPYLCFWTVFSW